MKADPEGFAQNAFEAAYNQTIMSRKPIWRSALARQALAYSLKAIAVFGGFAIASGRMSPYAQDIGLAVTAAVIVDGFFLNHVRMLLVTEAAQAYKRLANEARGEHTLRLGPILAIKETQPDKFRQKFIQFHDELTRKLISGCADIELALDKGHIKALQALALDSERNQPARGSRPNPRRTS